MCNDYGNRIPYSRYVEEFSHLRLPVFVQGNGPDLAPRAANKKPIFNFRSEKRDFTRTTRCLIPASHFFEFTAPGDPKQKRKNKWRFTLAGADWFCIAGIIRPDAIDGEPCFTMLTTQPGEDVAPYHDRQIVVLRREDWGAWLDLARPEAELLRPLPTGSLKARTAPAA